MQHPTTHRPVPGGTKKEFYGSTCHNSSLVELTRKLLSRIQSLNFLLCFVHIHIILLSNGTTMAAQPQQQRTSAPQLVKCYQCHDGKVKLTQESQNAVLRALSGRSVEGHQRVRRGTQGGRLPPVAEDVPCSTPLTHSEGAATSEDSFQCNILDYCILMTLIGANGTEIGHRRSCAEEFIAPYLMLLEDRIMTSPETNSFGMLRPQSEDLNSLLSPSRGNNGGNYGGGGSGGYNSIGGNSYYPSPTHTHPSSGRFHDIASDQPQPQFEVMSQENVKAARAAAAAQRMLDTLCSSQQSYAPPSSGEMGVSQKSYSKNDVRLDCKGIYSEAAICRIQCCSSPLCNSIPSHFPRPFVMRSFLGRVLMPLLVLTWMKRNLGISYG